MTVIYRRDIVLKLTRADANNFSVTIDNVLVNYDSWNVDHVRHKRGVLTISRYRRHLLEKISAYADKHILIMNQYYLRIAKALSLFNTNVRLIDGEELDLIYSRAMQDFYSKLSALYVHQNYREYHFPTYSNLSSVSVILDMVLQQILTKPSLRDIIPLKRKEVKKLTTKEKLAEYLDVDLNSLNIIQSELASIKPDEPERKEVKAVVVTTKENADATVRSGRKGRAIEISQELADKYKLETSFNSVRSLAESLSQSLNKPLKWRRQFIKANARDLYDSVYQK